eukprot:6172920-Pleurochrysis_carterae.AAC.2
MPTLAADAIQIASICADLDTSVSIWIDVWSCSVAASSAWRSPAQKPCDLADHGQLRRDQRKGVERLTASDVHAEMDRGSLGGGMQVKGATRRMRGARL